MRLPPEKMDSLFDVDPVVIDKEIQVLCGVKILRQYFCSSGCLSTICAIEYSMLPISISSNLLLSQLSYNCLGY